MRRSNQMLKPIPPHCNSHLEAKSNRVSNIYIRLRQIIARNIWLTDLDQGRLMAMGHVSYRRILHRQFATTTGLVVLDYSLLFVLVSLKDLLTLR